MNIFRGTAAAASLIACSLIALSTGKSVAQAEDGWAALNEELKSNYLDLSAQRKRIESLEPIPEARMAWDDPVAEIGAQSPASAGFDLDRLGARSRFVTITQGVPNLRKRSAMRDMALTDLAIGKIQKEVMIADLLTELKKSVYEFYFLGKAIETVSQSELILDQVVLAASGRYVAGKESQTNVIQAQLEKSMLRERNIRLVERRDLARISINRLLGRSERLEFTLPEGVIVTPEAPDFYKAWEKGEKNSPKIRLAEMEVEKARRAVEKERAESGLNFSFSAGYLQEDGPPSERSDQIQLKAAASLPLWHAEKQDQYVAGALAGLGEIFEKKRHVVHETRVALSKAVVSMEKEFEAITLYTTAILPQAQMAVSSAMVSYRMGKTDFMAALSSARTALEYRLALEESRYRLRSIAAEIDSLTGEVISTGEGKK
ncbi:MAG: TolC family protein [Nitrospinae bacterium]|nr:TolC family protein [Nitrospinota bacterium]